MKKVVLAVAVACGLCCDVFGMDMPQEVKDCIDSVESLRLHIEKIAGQFFDLKSSGELSRFIKKTQIPEFDLVDVCYSVAKKGEFYG